MKQQVSGEREKRDNDYRRCRWMHRGHPGQPDCQSVFSETQYPVAERLRRGVNRRAGAGLSAMGGKRDATGEKGSTPAPLCRRGAGGAEGKKGGSRGANEGVDHIPSGIDVGDFVREELEYIQDNGATKNRGMRKSLQRRWKMDDSETLQKPQGRDGRVKIQTRGKSGAEGEPQCFDRIHSVHHSKQHRLSGQLLLLILPRRSV